MMYFTGKHTYDKLLSFINFYIQVSARERCLIAELSQRDSSEEQ